MSPKKLPSFATGRAYPWMVVALLWVVALLNYMDRQMLSTMQDAMRADIAELNNAEAFGALMAIFLWIYGCVSPVAGIVTDRLNRKWLVVGSLFVWSGVTFLMGYAQTFEQLRLLRALMGVSEALYIPSALSLIADWHEGRSRSLAIGIHMTGLYTGQAIGGFGATVAALFSWQEAFHGFGMVGMAYAVVLMLFLYENPGRQVAPVTPSASGGGARRALQGLSYLASNAMFWVILFFFAAPSMPGWATKNWLPSLFADNLGMPMQEAGPLSTITIALSSFLGVIVGGWLSDRWVRRTLRGRIYTSAIGLGLTVPALIMMMIPDATATISAGLIFGIGYGMFDANNMPILCQFVPGRYRGTAYGIMNMLGVFAGALVTTMLGALADQGVAKGVVFALLSSVVAVALLLQLITLRPKTDNLE